MGNVLLIVLWSYLDVIVVRTDYGWFVVKCIWLRVLLVYIEGNVVVIRIL